MSKNKYDRILGALYGFAIGDAMGATTEFMEAHQIKAKYKQVTNIIGGGWLKLKAGQVTDDTQMTMCIIDALMECEGQGNNTVLERIADNFIIWVQSNPPDVGMTCMIGIEQLAAGSKPTVDDSALGNGSLMRAMPCALMGKSFVGLNVMQGRLTHNNTKCDETIELYHNVLSTMVEEDIDAILTSPQLVQPIGCITNTFNNACWWSSKETFRDCIIGAVNDGGDSDTIAAISGSLSGARLGFSAIPEKWILGLNIEVRNALETFADYAYNYHLMKSTK